MTTPSDSGLQIRALRSELAGPFNLDVPKGAIVCISGASGSGNSLCLRMIADLDPNEGEVVLNGVARSSLPANQWRRMIPYVAAESGWWAATATDHFQPRDLVTAHTLATRLGLTPALFDNPVERLSTGERQRLALIRALVLDSPALLLDEPTGPLDPESVAQVEALLEERAASGTIIVMASHDPAQAPRLRASQLTMSHRKLVEHA